VNYYNIDNPSSCSCL